MGLESASWISDLVSTNPVGATDTKSQGDDHLRLLKVVLQACFPNAAKAFYFPRAEAKTADFTVTSAHMHRTFVVDTTAGTVTATLPTLAAGDDGWECHFLKSNTGTNPLFIAPASGTLQSGEVSGLAKCRRVIPGHRCSARWTGSNWFISRVPNLPIGTTLEFVGATVPVGYEFAYGQTLASASTNYPEFYAVNGSSGVLPDDRGRVVAGKDDMGGSAASRLTSTYFGTSAAVLGAVGGSESHTLTTAQLPVVTPTGTVTITDPGHTHTLPLTQLGTPSAGVNNTLQTGAGYTVPSAVTGITASFTGTSFGSGTAHANVQPTIIRNKIVVLE